MRFISSRLRQRDCRLITTFNFAGTPASNIVRGPAADIRSRQNRRTRSAVELLTLSNRPDDSSVARAPPADEESDRIDRAVSQSSHIVAYGSRTNRSLQNSARIST
jgi:hypothetical protein